MKNKNFNTKKIAITAMAVICAFSSATAITAGAKTTQDIQAVMVLLGFQLRRTVLIPMIYLMDIQLFLTKNLAQ